MDVCMLYAGKPHPAHRVFGDAVDADYRHFETGQPPSAKPSNRQSYPHRLKTGVKLGQNYDVIVAEGTTPLQTALVNAAVNPSATHLYLAADGMFKLKNKYDASHELWRGLGVLANRLLDGCLAVSQDVYNWGAEYLGSLPVEIVHPPIAADKYSLLKQVDSTAGATNLNETTDVSVISIGRAAHQKNYQVLADAVRELDRELTPDVTGVFLGSGHPDQPYSTYPCIETPGYVPDEELPEYFGAATVYAQSSLGDAFPVGCLEGMLSATPTVVTDCCGTRSLLPETHVAAPTSTDLAETIRYVLELPEPEQIERGRSHREEVIGLTEEQQADRFATAVTTLYNQTNE